MPVSDLASIELRAYFVRVRNCLLVRGQFPDLYTDYYLHLMQHGIKHESHLDTMLKEGLAAMALHLASRPHDERCAWTINVHDPLLNIFVTGGGYPQSRITGRLFTEDVKNMGKSIIIAQTVKGNMPARQSMIEFQGMDVFTAVEEFYTQSEQRPTRFFRLPDEDFIQISAEPDADLDWLANLKESDIGTLDRVETLSLLETRHCMFDCGCTVDRMFPMLSRLPPDDIDYIFEDGPARITCPRCGAKYQAPRELFDTWMAEHPPVA